MQRGFTKPGDLKSTKPIYTENENTINKNGDIFYSNPRLANVCLYNLKGCLPDDGQVYLGNIQDFIK